jgi:hypothetical protein
LYEKFATLVITNAFNLGGNLDAFKYNALNIQRYSVLEYPNAGNLVLPASQNRGILIGNKDRKHGRIRVSDISGVLTVNWPVTIAKGSRLYKEGSGHLVLGNQLWFLNKNDTFLDKGVTGTDCSYYIDIRQGTVSATHCDAMNGAHIAFSNNTEMVMWVNPIDDNMKKYGIKCNKPRSATPLFTDMPIRLCVSGDEQLTKNTYKIPLVTVKEAYADDVAGKLKVTLDVKGYKLSGISRYAADGILEAITFYADIIHNGLVISVR